MVAEDSRWAHMASVKPARDCLPDAVLLQRLLGSRILPLSYLAVLALPDKVCLAPATTHLVHFLAARSAGWYAALLRAGGEDAGFPTHKSIHAHPVCMRLSA